MADQRTTATKPSRSDDVLDEVQQLTITEQVKAQFDSLLPKRPFKPSRSDPDPPTHPQPFLSDQYSYPELHKFRSLQSQGPFVVVGSHGYNDSALEDFAETRYYEKMQSVDKQHHTTGNGFIKVATGEEENGGRYYGNINLDGVGANGELVAAAVVRSNPATNDWVPTLPNHDQVFLSSKPKRSESD